MGRFTHRGEVSTTSVGGEASRVAETPISTVPSSDVKRTVSAAQYDFIGRRRGSNRNSTVAANDIEASELPHEIEKQKDTMTKPARCRRGGTARAREEIDRKGEAASRGPTNLLSR